MNEVSKKGVNELPSQSQRVNILCAGDGDAEKHRNKMNTSENNSLCVKGRGGIREYLDVALPSLGAMCADTWAFEMMTMIAAKLGPTEVGVWGLLLAQINLMFCFGVGLSVSGNVSGGAALGENSPAKACGIAKATSALAFASSFLSFLIISFWGRYITGMLTSDANLKGVAADINLAIATVISCDLIFFYLSRSPDGFTDDDRNGYRPDIMITIREGSAKRLVIIELTCPFEENLRASHSNKVEKYTRLKDTLMTRNCYSSIDLHCVEVGSRGFIANTLKEITP